MKRILLCLVLLLSTQSFSGGYPAHQKDVSEIAKVYVFLDFSCPICQYYLHTIQSLADQFSAKGISFTGVFPTQGVTADTLAYYAEKYRFRIPLIVDTSQVLTARYDAKVTPQAIVITPSGAIIYSGRIDNMFIKLGRRRQTPTTFELRDILSSVSGNNSSTAYTCSAPIGCIIERKKR